MRSIRPVFPLLIALALMVALTGCGNTARKPAPQNNNGQSSTPKKSYTDKCYVVSSLDEGGTLHSKSELETMYKDIAPDFDSYFYVQFFDNGTFVSPMVNGGGGTYYLKGSKVYAVDTFENYTGTISASKLTLVDKTGMKFTFALSDTTPDGTSTLNTKTAPELVDSDPILGDWEMTRATTLDGKYTATVDQLKTAGSMTTTPTLKFAKTHTMVMSMDEPPLAGTWSTADSITYVLQGGNTDSGTITCKIVNNVLTLTIPGRNIYTFEKTPPGP